MNKFYSQSGTTIVELILYVAIVAGLLVGVGGVSMNMFESKAKGLAVGEVSFAASRALSVIEEAVRGAQSITLPLIGNASTSVTLATASPSSNPTVIRSSGDNIEMIIGTNPPVLLFPSALRVSNVQFQNVSYPGPFRQGSVRVSFTVDAGTNMLTQSYRFSSSFASTATIRSTQ